MTEVQEYDVVVVGSGGGAMTGAFLAAKAGLSTVVVEKTSLLGGTSAYSGGACWLPGSQVQQRAGIPDSTESARDLPRARCWSSPDEGKVEAFLAHAPELVAELEADPAIDFEWLPFSEYYDAPGRVPMGRSIQPTSIKRGELPARGGRAGPAAGRARPGRRGRAQHALRRAGADRAAARRASLREGGTVLTDLPVTGLVTEAAGRREWSGVAAMTPEGPIEIRARRGVLVAAGGFEGNAALRAAARRARRRRLDDGTGAAPTPASRSRRRSRSAPPTDYQRGRLVLPRVWSSPTAAAPSRSASAPA